MTETALRASGAIRVFVCPPTPVNAKGVAPQKSGADATVVGYQFPWSWNGFTEARQLIPITSVDVPGDMGHASFRLLRATRQEIGRKAFATLTDIIVEGCWIAIVEGSPFTTDAKGKPTATLDPSSVVWCGWISSIEVEQLAGSTETMGSVSALGLGHLLDTRQIYGWSQVAADTAYPASMGSPPMANVAGPENSIIGNCTLLTNNVPSGENTFVFTRMPAEAVPATFAAADPNTWTRWRLLKHMLAFCQPQIGPSFRITLSTVDGSGGVDPSDTTTIAGVLNDTTIPESFDLQNLTFKGALDLLIPDTRGFGWYLTVSDAGWNVVIYTIADTTAYGVPVNTQQAQVLLPSEPVMAVSKRSSALDLWDEIVYESANPIVFSFTVGGPDKNLVKMWSTAQETAYKAGASAASGYSSLTQAQQRERNSNVRGGPALRDVFTKFGFNRFSARDVLRFDPPITTLGAGNGLALIPEARWDGTSLALDTRAGHSRTPYLLTARFLRTLPWPEGLQADGTDIRDAFSKAQPQYLPPRVFRYDTASATNGGYTWVDLCSRNGRPGFISVSVDVDDRSPALRIIASPPELLAYKNWSGSPTPAISDIDPETDGRALDYSKLCATVAMESDQRIQVIIPRPGATVTGATNGTALPPIATPGATNIRRSMIVRDDKLHCWITMKNTVLGVKPDGTADLVTLAHTPTGMSLINDTAGKTVGMVMRNDWPVAQRRATQLAAFVYRKRLAVSITRARSDDRPTWARVGTLLTKVVEVAADTSKGTAVAEVSIAPNTVVVEVARTYGDRPSMRVSSDMPTMLNVGGAIGGGSPSATGGGRASVVGGGTLPQQVADLQKRANVEEREGVRVPLIPARGGASVFTQRTVQIIGGNTLTTGQAGCKYVSSPITSVPTAYDPAVDTSFIDGICVGNLFENGIATGTKVLVLNDSTATPQRALVASDVVAVQATAAIAVAGDPNGATVAVYPAQFL
jgi:hypothetical protein